MTEVNLSAIVKAVETLDEVMKVGHEVAELIPSKEKKGEIYQIGAGSKADLALQQSMFMTNYQLFNNSFGSQPENFKKWCDAFEESFPTTGGFPQKTTTKIDGTGDGSTPWNQPRTNRPRIIILNAVRTEDVPTYLYIEFYPERDNKDEVYYIEGTQIQVKHWIWMIWYTRQILESANLVHVLGQTPSDWIRKRPFIGCSVHFICYSYPTKPFYQSKDRPDFKKAEITVPFVDRTKLTYQNIRNVLGGANGMDWGLHKAVAWVADQPNNFAGYRGMPQIWCKGSTYANAKANVKRIHTLSNSKIARMNKGEVDNEEFLNPMAKENPPSRVYPGIMYVLNSNIVGNNLTPGRQRSLAKYDHRKNRLKIYTPEEPPNFQENLNDLFSNV